MNGQRILLVGLTLSQPPDFHNSTIETRGLCDPSVHQSMAAAPLYDYDVIVIYPKTYSHIIFGAGSAHSESKSELFDLKHENNSYDLDTAFDRGARSLELQVALEQGTTIIWLATEDKRAAFFGQRSLYTGYLHQTPLRELSSTPIYKKSSKRLVICDERSPFVPYIQTFGTFGWDLCWSSTDSSGTLATTPEGYTLAKSFELEGRTAWLLAPPPSEESLHVLLHCALSLKYRSHILHPERNLPQVNSKERNRYIVALQKCIEQTFDEAKWMEVAYITDTVELITRHPRLLASLRWGDPDYPAQVFRVLPQIIDHQEENLSHLVRVTNLLEWTRSKEPELYLGLGGHDTSPVENEIAPHLGDGMGMVSSSFDVFISHASEDKAEVAIPLADELRRRGLKVWLDASTLRLGDSLSRSIDLGLARSRFGVVVLSPSFFSKEWPQRELQGLVAREVRGQKVILPVMHKITVEEVSVHSPTLADKLAVFTVSGISRVADEIERVIRK